MADLSVEAVRELYDFQATDPGIQAQRRLDTMLRDMYFDEHLIAAPDTAAKGRKRKIEPERMSTGEPARIIDLQTSFYVNWPRLSAQWSGLGSYTEAKAERAGQAWNEMFDELNPAVDSPWANGAWQIDLYGRTVDLILPGNQYYWDFPVKQEGQSEEDYARVRREWKKRAPLPILWLTLPAETTFPASLAAVDDEVLSTKITSWRELEGTFSKAELADTIPEKPEDRRKPVTLAIYSDRERLAYAVLAETKTGGFAGVGAAYKDKVLRTIEHKLGRSAIAIIPGVTTARREYPYYWRSSLYPVLGLIQAADKIATAARTGSKFNVAPLLKLHMNDTQGPGVDGAQARIEDFFENDMFVLDPGNPTADRAREDVQPVYQPEAGQGARELLAWTLERSGRMTGAMEVLEGQVSPTAPAWSQNYAGEMAKGKNRPLTSAHAARAVAVAEMIGRAAQAWGEDITLARFDEKGQRDGDIVFHVSDAEEYTPVLASTYEPKVPANWRADFDIMLKAMQLAIAKQVIISPQWLMERFGGEFEFWSKHYKEWQELIFMLTPKVQAIQEQDIADRFEANLTEEEQMTMQQFDQKAQGLSPVTAQILRKFVPGQNGASVTPQTQGALRAASPFSTPAGGPQPNEMARS